MRIAIVTAAAAGLFMLGAGGAFAAASTDAAPKAQNSKMAACAKQWNDMKAANKTGGQTYQQFSKTCMSGSAAAAPAASPAPAAKPAAAVTPPPAVAPAKPAMAAAKPAMTATKTSGGASAQNQKMKDCATKWNAMKAANKTGGQTYKQFSSSCLKG